MRGRPPRVPGERLERVALSLRSATLFGLELIARDRRTSLSQAAEYALVGLFNNYKIDGEPVAKLLDIVETVESDPKLSTKLFGTPDRPEAEFREVIQQFYRDTKYARIQGTPAHLRTAEEKFLFDALQIDGPKDFTQGKLLLSMVAFGIQNGLSPEDVANMWLRECVAARSGEKIRKKETKSK